MSHGNCITDSNRIVAKVVCLKHKFVVFVLARDQSLVLGHSSFCIFSDVLMLMEEHVRGVTNVPVYLRISNYSVFAEYRYLNVDILT